MTPEKDPLLERIDRMLADEFALAMTTAPMPAIVRTEATVERVAEYARWLEEAVPKPLEIITMTQQEFDALAGDAPCPGSRFRYGGPLADLTGIPIELVDNPEKSDLWRMGVDELRRKLADLGLVDAGSAREDDHKTVICSPVDEPRVSRAANGFLADVVASEFVKPGQLMISISPAPSPVARVGFDEPVEPRADQTRGWLARLFERWSR